MIKTFQWIYQMGVKHERLRIKKLATELAQQINGRNQSHIDSHMNPSSRPDANPVLRRKQIDMEVLINERAMEVLDHMIYPQPAQDYSPEYLGPLIDREEK